MTTLKLAYFPAFDDQDELVRQLVRAAWYFSPLQSAAFTMGSDLEDPGFRVPDCYDSTIEPTLKKLRSSGRARLVPAQELRAAVEQSDAVVCWRGIEALDKELGKGFAERYQANGGRILNVDCRHRMEGSLYIDALNKLHGPARHLEESQTRFHELSRRASADDAFLFCTGPSISDYSNYRFDRGVSVICNSVINDTELMEAVRPTVHVFADPIFHFGCSRYAQLFRDQLSEVAPRFDLSLVLPEKYYTLFRHHSPELADRIIALPFSKDVAVNLDLNDDFRLHTTDNVLTFLMLPVGGSLARRVHLLGCDGRKLEEDDYFWTHNPSTQFVGEMDSIQEAHPSFFKLDYNEYYIRHCETLAQYLETGERLGKRFFSMTFSHIPALKEREHPYFEQAHDEGYRKVYLSINPDLVDAAGHNLSYDLRIREGLSKPAYHSVLAGHEACNGLPCPVRNVFAKRSWHARSVTESQLALDEFAEIVSSEVELALQAFDTVSAYMYTGDAAHVVGIADVLERWRGRVHAHINLFWSHQDVDCESISVRRENLYAAAFDRARVNACLSVYVDSSRVADALDQRFGFKPPIWPMIGVSNPRLVARVRETASGSGGRKRIFCPANGQIAKGFDLFCSAITRFQKAYPDLDVEFVVRDYLRGSAEENEKLQELVEELRSRPGVRLLPGALDEERYLSEYAAADVVVLPYRRSSFATRTSGALVDALSFDGWVLVTQDTWLSDAAAGLPGTATFVDGDADDLAARMIELARLPRPERNSKAIAEAFSAERLIAAINAEERRQARPRKSDVAVLAHRQRKTRDDVLRLQRQVFELQRAIESMTQMLKDLGDGVAGNGSDQTDGKAYLRFDRFLSRQDINAFTNDWAPKLGLEMRPQQIEYLADRIRNIEEMCSGRLATSVQNQILRLLVALGVKDADLEILEIGTLFGISMISLLDIGRERFDHVHATAVDPLEGYYGQEVDVLTGAPVTSRVVRHNCNIMCIDSTMYTLICHRSEEEEAIKVARKRRYNWLLIDGDHSYEGVARDFENYLPLMRPGGFVLFDDYKSDDWPDIERFIDDEIMPREDLTFVGAGWRTAIFRVNE